MKAPLENGYALYIARLKLEGRLGHSNLISCCRWTDRLNFLHLALENENLFLEINYDVILDHVTICRLGARI